MSAWRAALVALWLPAIAAAAADARFDQLMAASGLQKQVGTISAQMLAGAFQARVQAELEGREPIADAEFHRMQAAMARAYSPDRMRARVRAELERQMRPEDLQPVMAWLSSPLGRRFTSIEERHSEEPGGLDSERVAHEFAATLPPARIERMRRLAMATSAGESGASLVVNLLAGVLQGLALASPRRDTSGVEALRRRLEAQNPQLVEVLTRRAIADNAHTYRDVSDEDMDAYVAFAESPAGLRYHKATAVALDKAFITGSREMGRALRSPRADRKGV